jgi:hypothetical protein
LREDNGALAHLFHEVAVRLFGAVQRVDLVALFAPDDQRIDVTVSKSLKRLFRFCEAGEQRVAAFVQDMPALVLPGRFNHLCSTALHEGMRSSPRRTRSR